MYGEPSEQDHLGEVFLASSKQPSLEDYYYSLLKLAPVVRAQIWTKACTDYYLSSVDGGRLRLAYFTPDVSPAKALDWIRSETGLRDVKEAVAPRDVDFTINYGAAGAGFRRWLCMYPQVVLDLRESDWMHARRLAMTYRFEVSWTRLPARSHFEESFLRASNTYGMWSEEKRDFFWASFDYWAGPKYTDWGHFFVNAVLALDWHHPFGPTFPAPPSRSEINRLLMANGYGFDIPLGWNPSKGSC